MTSAQEQSDELVRFREEWKAEVQQRKAQANGSAPPPPLSLPETSPTRIGFRHSRAVANASTAGVDASSLVGVGAATSPPEPTLPPLHGQTRLTPALRRAVDIYRRAVHHEQQGEVDDALPLYRQAFRLDPHVDRAYHRDEQIQLATAHSLSVAGSSPSLGAIAHRKNISTASADESTRAVDALIHGVGSMMLKLPSGGGMLTGSLARLIAQFPPNLEFEAEDERVGVPLHILPDELLVYILRMLDPTTIERFAVVSRKARAVSLDTAIWRDFVKLTYKPPQIPREEAMAAIMEKYLTDYRRVYIEHPRLRLDGVYIAVCHYVRSGLSENAWVNISHLITYHRYLRFLPDGQALSLLANEEYQPQQVIPVLKPGLRMKGFHIGEWHLEGTTVYIENLIEMSDKGAGIYTPSDENAPKRYVFRMTLGLRSRPLGRWNKLDFEGYESVDVESGEAIKFPLKHDRPFWFSKVRSYAL